MLGWHGVFLIASTRSGALPIPIELAGSLEFAVWDAIILTTTAAALDCGWLLSEDMEVGFTWRG